MADPSERASTAGSFLRELAGVSQASIERELYPAPAGEFTGTERFAIEARLGAGGFGTVYAAFDRALSARVALKVLARPDPRWLYRFKLEFRALGHLVHRNLATRYELSCDRGRWFFTMELVDGEDFLAHVRPGGRLDELRLRAALAQLAQGLSALHDAGLVHRDVKPPNALVERGGRVVLLDFGLATAADPHASVELEAAGTPRYMSPEQRAGRRLGPPSDWYAVGVVLHQALSGQLPEGQPALPRSAPDDLAALCRELLGEAPELRPTGAEVLARLGVPRRRHRDPAPRAPFVGRARELEALLGAAREVAEQREPRWVAISGPPGIGKTALAARLVEQLRARDGSALVLRGGSHDRETLPYKALDGVADALGRHLRGLPEVEAARLLPDDAADLLRLFPALGKAQPAQPPADPLRAAGALRELLGRLARAVPVALVLDDLQWGDAGSAALLAQVLAPPRAPAVLIVSCQRAGEEQTSAVLQALRELRESALPPPASLELQLGELSREELGELARQLARDAGRSTVEGLSREADGNPHLLTELAQHRAPGERPTLEAALQSSLAALPAGARALLEVAAAAGRPLPMEVAQAAAGSGSRDPAVLAALRAGHFLRRRDTALGAELECYHPRIAEAVLRALGEPERRDRQAAIAAQCELAAGQAAQALAPARAVRLYAEALRAAPGADERRWDLQARLGEALAGAGRPAEAASAFAAARGQAPRGAREELLRHEAEQLWRAGQVTEASLRTREALAAAGLPLPASPAGAYLAAAFPRLLVSSAATGAAIDASWAALPPLALFDPRSAKVMHARHARLARRSGTPAQQGRALAASGLVAALSPSGERQAERFFQRARELVLHASDLEAQAQVRALEAMASCCLGHFGTCEASAETALGELPDARLGTALEAGVRAARLSALFWTGGWAELAELHEVERREHERRGDAWQLFSSLSQAGWLGPLVKDEVAAVDRLARELALVGLRLPRPPPGASVHLPRAWAALYRGDGQAALAEAGAHWQALTGSGALGIAVVALGGRQLLAAALLQAGQLAQARREARSMARLGLPAARALGQLMVACADAQEGHPQAPARLAAAEQALARAELLPFAMAARRARGGDDAREADAWFTAKGVRAAGRLAHALAPARGGESRRNDNRPGQTLSVTRARPIVPL